MAGRIVLFGATGYTGRLTAERLVARGRRPVLAGRSRERLEQMAAELGGLETAVADVGRPTTVYGLVERGDVLLTTVGPFNRWGTPALDAAIEKGAHYIDSTGEGAFIRRVFEREGWRAEGVGCALLTACACDWVPGNLAGALALREAGEHATGVRIGYLMRGSLGPGDASGGTRTSMMDVMLSPHYRWHGGRIVEERAAARVRDFDLDGRGVGAISVAASEAFGLPQAFPGLRDVDVYLGWFGGAARPIAAVSRGTSALLRIPGARATLQRGAARHVSGSTGGPDEERRARTGSEVVAEALDSREEVLAEVRLTGGNVYDFSAGILAWAAERAAAGDLRGVGALGPVAAFGLEALEEGAAQAGLRRPA
jgi:short subunit dehydrogenase-like uncharacterized protein